MTSWSKWSKKDMNSLIRTHWGHPYEVFQGILGSPIWGFSSTKHTSPVRKIVFPQFSGLTCCLYVWYKPLTHPDWIELANRAQRLLFYGFEDLYVFRPVTHLDLDFTLLKIETDKQSPILLYRRTRKNIGTISHSIISPKNWGSLKLPA